MTNKLTTSKVYKNLFFGKVTDANKVRLKVIYYKELR